MAKKGKSDQSRFVRSVNVESDLLKADALDGYVLTATGRSVIRRLSPKCLSNEGPSAWTLTGPYGTGKSAFAVFAANLFARNGTPITKRAREILKTTDKKLADEILGSRSKKSGLLPIAVTGTREPIQNAILRGLDYSVSHIANGSGKAVSRDVKKALKEVESGKNFSGRKLTNLLDSTLDKVCTKTANFDGIFIVVDELGKMLEYANSQPTQSDIGVLQSVAEFAQRAEKPCLLMTVLHQDFGAYSNRLSDSEKAEWEKIRGRFEDIAFEEPAEELLRLVASALDQFGKLRGTAPSSFNAVCNKAWSLGMAPGSMTKANFVSMLKQCWPMHPLVAVMLGNVFRKLAQNERSAFSFLFSGEPFGFREFLESEPKQLYGIDRLYDYLNNSARDSLYGSSNAKQWAEIETILRSYPDGTAPEEFLIKSVGLINAIGQSGKIRSSDQILDFAATQAVAKSNPAVNLKTLVKKKLLVNRKYNKTYALWEGSDVDLEAQIRIARDKLDPKSQTAAKLAGKYYSPRPIVARRHSFETGALKYFPIHFKGGTCKPSELKSIEGPAILVLLGESVAEEKKAQAFAKSAAVKKRDDLVCCVPAFREGFATDIRDLTCLEWVVNNVKDLDGDRAARRELSIQMEGLRSKLDDSFDGYLKVGTSKAGAAKWFFQGKEFKIKSGRAFQDKLSAICDNIYPQSPRLLNELINRRAPSSQSAGARNKLIEQMVEHAREENVGITGTPPEMSMYRSVLERTGIHSKNQEGEWGFGKPKSNADAGIKSVWKAIEKFFSDSEKGPKTLAELYNRLKAPPFGMLDGPLPILASAALLAYDSEVALYREGSFIPVINAPEFELIVKSPDKYSVQKWKVSGVRTAVFEQLAELVGRDIPGDKIGKPEILQIVRPLISFAKSLNDYTQHAPNLSKEAKSIRDILLKANRPDSLIFKELPKACGVKEFSSRGKPDRKAVAKFITTLRGYLGELQQCYQKLLNSVLASIRIAFSITGDVSKVREELASRAAMLGECKGDATLSNFVRTIKQTELDDNQWLEAIAARLAIKPPPKWKAIDQDKFDQTLGTTARLFQHVESMTFGNKKLNSDDFAVRVGITNRNANEVEKVIAISSEQVSDVQDLKKELETFLKKKRRKNRKLVAAALAKVLEAHL